MFHYMGCHRRLRPLNIPDTLIWRTHQTKGHMLYVHLYCVYIHRLRPIQASAAADLLAFFVNSSPPCGVMALEIPISKRWIALGFINQGQSTTAQDELQTAWKKDELYLSSIRACIDRPRNSACSDMTTLLQGYLLS